MSRREELIYQQMKAAGETEIYENVFFFPTKEDAKKARKWLKTALPSGRRIEDLPLTSTMSMAFRLVSERAAVPVAYLETVRNIEARIEEAKDDPVD